MARIWQTGVEMGHIGILDLGQSVSGVVTSPTAGPWSIYALQEAGVGDPNAGGVFSIGTQSELYVGCRIYWNAATTPGDAYFLSMADGATNQLKFAAITGHLQVQRGDNTVLGTASASLSPQTWYWVEMHATFNDSTGVVDVRQDTASVIALTGQDTKNSANTTADRIGLGGSNSWIIDDLVVNNTSGAHNNSWPGDTKITGLFPNAAGDSTALSRGGANSGTNYGQVDEKPPNDATDYVYGSASNSYDLYNLPNLSGYDSVQAVVAWVRAQKSDAGTGNVAVMISSGGSENQGSDQALSTSWNYFKQVYDVDPTDSAAWTTSKVDALQVGPKVR